MPYQPRGKHIKKVASKYAPSKPKPQKEEKMKKIKQTIGSSSARGQSSENSPPPTFTPWFANEDYEALE